MKPFIAFLNCYYKFLFFDSIESMIDCRNTGHIYTLLTMFATLVKDPKNTDNSNMQIVIKSVFDYYCKEEGYLYKLVYNNDEQITKIVSDITTSLITPESVERCIINNIAFKNAFFSYFHAYKELARISGKSYFRDLLVEFHNAMSHLLTAISKTTEFLDTNDESLEIIANRNIDRANAHLNRSTCDSKKIIIKCAYPIIKELGSKNGKHNEFLKELVGIRFNEIECLSNRQEKESIQKKIADFTDKWCKYIQSNKEWLDMLCKNINAHKLNTNEIMT